jgi:hypothetical protein
MQITKKQRIKEILIEKGQKITAKEVSLLAGTTRQYVALVCSSLGLKTKSKKRDRTEEIRLLMPFLPEIEKELIISKQSGTKKQKVLEKYGLNFDLFYKMRERSKKI